MSHGALTETIRSAVAAIRSRTPFEPDIAIILGTGLGRLAAEVEAVATLPYSDIPGFPEPTVETHSGRLILGHLSGKKVAVMQGRFHRYEGYTLQQVTLPVRVLRRLGAGTLIVSNVSGGMNPLWRPGDIMILDDHINLLGDNPLIGPNLDEFGPRFPDMSRPYDPELQALTETVSLELGMIVRRGVYVAVPGPNLETRAEYRMLRALGADVVGMSTVPEVIVARHADMRVLGLSIITDQCLPDALEPANVEEIIRIANETEPRLTALVRAVLERIPLPA